MSYDDGLLTIQVENNSNKLVKVEPSLKCKDEHFLNATKSTENTISNLKVEYNFEDVSCHLVHIKQELYSHDTDKVATAVVQLKEVSFFEHRSGTLTTSNEPDNIPFYAVNIKEERLQDRDDSEVTTLNKFDEKSENLGDKSYVCKICNFKCARKDTLKRHAKTHSNEKPFACNMCDFKCKRRDVLKSHVDNHKGEKPFLCDICRLTFAQRRYLIIHMRTHSGEKPYTCATCGNKFSHQSTLSNHAKIHFINKTGEKPFTCVICNLKFTRKFTLSRHLLKHNEKNSLNSK